MDTSFFDITGDVAGADSYEPSTFDKIMSIAGLGASITTAVLNRNSSSIRPPVQATQAATPTGIPWGTVVTFAAIAIGAIFIVRGLR